MDTNVIYSTAQELNEHLQHLAQLAGKTIDMKNPLLDISFQGIRLQATYAEGDISSRYVITKNS